MKNKANKRNSDPRRLIDLGHTSYKAMCNIITDNPDSIIVKVASESKPRLYDRNDVATFLAAAPSIISEPFVLYPGRGVEKRYNLDEIFYAQTAKKYSYHFITPHIKNLPTSQELYLSAILQLILSTIVYEPIKATLLCVNKRTISFLFHSDAQNHEQDQRDEAAVNFVLTGILQDSGLVLKDELSVALQVLGIDKSYEEYLLHAR